MTIPVEFSVKSRNNTFTHKYDNPSIIMSLKKKANHQSSTIYSSRIRSPVLPILFSISDSLRLSGTTPRRSSSSRREDLCSTTCAEGGIQAVGPFGQKMESPLRGISLAMTALHRQYGDMLVEDHCSRSRKIYLRDVLVLLVSVHRIWSRPLVQLSENLEFYALMPKKTHCS